MDKSTSSIRTGYNDAYWFWRRQITSAVNSFGGIAWQPNRLGLICDETEKLLRNNVGFSGPSPFKRAAAFSLAFMDPNNYPIFGEFERHKYKDDFDGEHNWSGAILVFEYVRYSLDGAVINEKTLSKPIRVSSHTYKDIVHALTHVRSRCCADFHILSLLYEQLVYLENPDVSYPRDV